MNNFYETFLVSKGWIIAPEVTLEQSKEEKVRFRNNNPKALSNLFRINPTHVLKLDKVDKELEMFLILCYGFLQGLYLTPENCLYLNKIPYKPGKLNGLILTNNDRTLGMEQIYKFYFESSKTIRDQVYATIHWFLISQTFSFQWDKFDAQYKVLDGIYKAAGVKANSHAERPLVLANKFNLSIPEWAKLITKRSSSLSNLRNQLVHEAKYNGYPIGWSFPKGNYVFELTAFNTKLLCSILGIDTPYLSAKPENVSYWGWDIKAK